MGIHDQKTKLVNKTGQLIRFDVDHGICPLRDLPAGKSRSVSLSLIRKRCRERGSADWPIRVLINNRFLGMRLHPRHHILKMTRIVFRYRWRSDGSCVPIAEGVMENFVDRVFGCCCCINWEKRIYIKIAEADSSWNCIRSSQDPDIVGPLGRNLNNQQLREVGDPDTVAAPLIGPHNSLQFRRAELQYSARWRKKITGAFPTQKMRIGRLWNGGGAAVGAAVESRKRLYRLLLSLRRRDEFNRFLLFALAFTLVASLHLYRIWLSYLRV